MSHHTFFTSESVAVGHPDKVADQISDAILDACLAQDPDSYVACETVVTTGLVILAGEVSTKAHLDFQKIVRDAVRDIGYDSPGLGFDSHSCAVINTMHQQSADIAQGVLEGQGFHKEQGAGDQGMMFGFACDETPQFMPMPIMLAHQLVAELLRLRKEQVLPYLRPDGKVQVTIEYDEQKKPLRAPAVVISTQHAEDVDHATIVVDMMAMIKRVIPGHLLDQSTRYYINPTGRFVIGGPHGDCGLTGRKIIVDTYGGMGRHGGGCFSGKDPSKVDRSAGYATRYVAKTIVAAKLAKRCEVQVAYAIGYSHPVSISIDTFGTGTVDDALLKGAIEKVFDLSPKGIIRMLDLKRPIYRQTAYGGHFGRDVLKDENVFTWERLDRVPALQRAVEQELQKAKACAKSI